MLVKALELILIITIISFIFLYMYQISETIYTSYKTNYQFLERFLRGRFLIKFLTESSIFSNGICNLNQNFTRLIDGSLDFYSLINYSELTTPSKIEIFDISDKKKIAEIGNYTGRYISFSRVCNYDGKLIKIRVLV